MSNSSYILCRPVNLLITTPYRFVYAAIFGAMAGDLIYYVVYSTGLFSGHDNPLLNAFLTGGTYIVLV